MNLWDFCYLIYIYTNMKKGFSPMMESSYGGGGVGESMKLLHV